MFDNWIEVTRFVGNNFDVVTYKHRKTGTLSVVREYHNEEYVDVDQREGTSPARWGT